MNSKRVTPKSILNMANIDSELKYFEMIYTDMKRDISWKKKHFWDRGFRNYVEMETCKIDEMIDLCHKQIAEMDSVPDKYKPIVWERLNANLNDLKQLLYRVEVITDVHSEYLSYAE